jgi:hypothetical protein
MAAAAALALMAARPAAGGEDAPGVVRFTAVGKVIAIEDRSQTVVIRSDLEGQEWIVGAWITPETTIERRGAPARFSDLTVGSHVRIQYERQPDEQAGRALVFTILPNGSAR